MTSLWQGSRLVSIALAVGVHAAAAAAFMLTPKIEPPPPPDAVEIELLTEITSESAEEVSPAVAAETTEIEQAQEAEVGEAQTVTGAEVGALASLDTEQAEVTPDEAKPVEQPDTMPEVADPPEVEPTEVPDVASPVELEKPVIEAPQAPAIVKKPKPVAKKKVKKEPRRATLAGATVSKDVKRKGVSRSVSSGGRQSGSSYASLVNARLAARRSRIQSLLGSGTRGRVVITFSIGQGGSVRSASVTTSSGNARLDSAARSVVAATSFPPPPNGSFSGRVPISVAVQ